VHILLAHDAVVGEGTLDQIVTTLKIIIAGLAALAYAFLVWRWTSVARGARQRDAKLLARIEPIGKKLDAGDSVTPDEIEDLAARPEIRFMLYAVIRHMGRADLLPTRFDSSIEQGESALAYWMMHPNELQDAPELIEFIETIRRSVDSREAEFHVYRYKMAPGHWAAKDGWLLGLAGPMSSDGEPYAETPGAFSRVGDLDGKVAPADLVDWYVAILRAKGIIQ
jgi:hypothetical protein